MSRNRASIAALVLVVMAAACGSGDSDERPAGACDLANALDRAGELTVATSEIARAPWVLDGDPTSGRGFESALVYAIADELGIDSVKWTTVAAEDAVAPGAKDFDLAIQQLPITTEATESVDFSNSYYQVEQVIVGGPDSTIPLAQRLADLRDLRLGVMSGTNGLGFVETEIAPATPPLVFEDTAAAKAALESAEVDGILLGLPAAYAMIDAATDGATILVVLPRVDEEPEELAMAFAKSSPLVQCVNDAVEALRNEGKLAELEAEWLDQQGRISSLNP